nr:hypothetical protein [Tanacetum cinerariifolium]
MSSRKVKSQQSEPESWRKDQDDSNNEQDSRSEESDDDNTQSDSEKGSDSKHETDENESNSDMITELLDHVYSSQGASQPQSSYETVSLLTKFELKKILIGKMDKSESYLVAPEHRKCYEGLIKSYKLDKTLFSTYDKVYLLKRSQKEKDKDEDPFAGSDRGLKKRKISKDAKPTKEELEFKVADTDMPQDQDENPGNDNKEPKGKVTSKRDWFTKPKRPQEPTNPNWNEGKTPQQGPTQNLSAYIMNDLKISNLTQETLLGPAFKLLKGTRSNYAKLEYDFEEYYKALSEKLDWDNPEGGDYPFNLTKPLPLVMNGNRQIVLVDYFFNNDLKYLQSGILTMTYTTSLTQIKAAQYDLPGIEDMNRLINLSGDDVFDFVIALRMFTRSIVIQKRVDDLQLAVKSYKKKINVTKPETTDLESGKRTHTLHIKTLKLKERRMMRSLKNFVGGRHYGNDLQLLQQTI